MYLHRLCVSFAMCLWSSKNFHSPPFSSLIKCYSSIWSGHGSLFQANGLDMTSRYIPLLKPHSSFCRVRVRHLIVNMMTLHHRSLRRTTEDTTLCDEGIHISLCSRDTQNVGSVQVYGGIEAGHESRTTSRAETKILQPRKKQYS